MIERQDGEAIFVAVAPPDSGAPAPRIIGFASGARSRHLRASVQSEGEVQTLYVQDDWRERGVGRRLMRAAAAHLAAIGCGSVSVWVLSENPARWFYQRLGGQAVASGSVHVAGQGVSQTAFSWDPIEKLLRATAPADGA
jgi:ribosomal protein S18 acetylase RimI-like enzyme